MKKYLRYIVSAVLLMILSGCHIGNGGGDAGTQTVETGATVLVYPGDRVTPLSTGTEVQITNIYADGYSSVTVLSGSIEVIRG